MSYKIEPVGRGIEDKMSGIIKSTNQEGLPNQTMMTQKKSVQKRNLNLEGVAYAKSSAFLSKGCGAARKVS